MDMMRNPYMWASDNTLILRRRFPFVSRPCGAGVAAVTLRGGLAMVDPAPSSTVDVRPSPIEGLGLFAWRAFRPGEVIRTVNIVRETTAEAPLRPELGERQGHCDYPDGRIVRSGPPDCHLNHSCDPNAWIPYTAAGCEIVARCAVQVGEEITCDYSINLTGGDAWSRRCGAAPCRGTVVGDYFQLPPGLQREYAPYLADWFVRRHAGALRAAGITR